MVFTLPQFQNHSFLHAINRSLNVSNNTSVSQGLMNNSFTEQCIPPLATSPNVTFSPKCMARNLLEGLFYKTFLFEASSYMFFDFWKFRGFFLSLIFGF